MTVLIARRRDWRRAAQFAIAVVGSVATYDVLDPVVGRRRPPSDLSIGHNAGAAFPNGHAAAIIAFWGMVAAVLPVFALVADPWRHVGRGDAGDLLVGTSRIYLGAHWLTDVLAGYARV